VQSKRTNNDSSTRQLPDPPTPSPSRPFPPLAFYKRFPTSRQAPPLLLCPLPVRITVSNAVQLECSMSKAHGTAASDLVAEHEVLDWQASTYSSTTSPSSSTPVVQSRAEPRPPKSYPHRLECRGVHEILPQTSCDPTAAFTWRQRM